MGSNAEHTELVNDMLVALNSFPRTRAFKMTVGSGFTWRGQPVKFGVPGMFDVLVLRGERYVWLDAKTGSAVLSSAQVKFQRMVHMLGGVAEPVRSVEEALKIVQPA